MENTINIDLVSRYMKDFWPKYSKKLYSSLYNTYHPSAYSESFNRPSSNFEDSLETLEDAVHEGKKLGLIDSSVGWSDTYHYDSRGNAITKFNKEKQEWVDTKRLVDGNGLPTLNDQLEIMDRTNLDWIHGILLFDVLYDIVDEFKHYCGENGIDESGMGECMDEFPPYGANRTGTLKQDYYTLFNFMKDLERVGVPVSKIIKSYKLTPIKLVDTGTSDYNEEGQSRMEHGTGDWDNMKDAEEILMDVPNRLEEQDTHSEKEGPTQSLFQKTLKDMGVQLQFVGTFGFGISGMFGMVKDLLEGKYPSLSEGEIILIFLSALSYLSINVVKDISQLKSELTKRGLGDYLNKTVEVLKDFENISLKIVEKAGFTVSSLSELLGYTFLLVPILDITNKLIEESGFDVVSLASYLKGALISVGIFYIRNVFNSLVIRLKRKREKRKMYSVDLDFEDEELDDEMIEEGEIVGNLLSERFKGCTILTQERIGELSLLDENVGNKNLKWIVREENKINWLNHSITNLLESFYENNKLFTNTNIKEVGGDFKNLDPKDLNNYESIIELNYTTKRLIKKSRIHEEVYMSKIAEKATTDVVRDIFEVVSLFDGGDEYFLLPDYYSDKDGDEYRYGELQFNVEVNILENEQVENFVLDSAMGGDYDDTIYVDVVLSRNFTEKDYESLQIILSEYIRHEIEHLLQIIDGDRPDIIDKDDKMSPFEYYSQKHEMDAQKVGFERRAKMEDKSIEEVIKDYLGYRQSIDNLSDSEKQQLISKLSN